VDLRGDVAHVESCVTRFTTEKNGKRQIVTGRYIDITARNTKKMLKAPSRREFLKVAAQSAALALATPLVGRAASSGDGRPNILFLLTDDQRFDAVGYVNEAVLTPHIDKLASASLRFRNMFVTTPICAISRASIFTGMYGRRHRCDFSTSLSSELAGYSYPALMRRAGYRTAFFGKYGVGDGMVTGKILTERPTAAERAGFDVIENFGFSYYLDGDPDRKHHIHDILTERSEAFLDSCVKDQPFCLSVSFVSPHENMVGHFPEVEQLLPAEPDLLSLYHGKTFADRPLMNEKAFETLPDFLRHSYARLLWQKLLSTPEQRLDYLRKYNALISGIDRVIGRLVHKLEAMDLLSNTIIIFTSDNGFFLGDYEMSEKWFGYEPSIRVPLFIRLPGVVGGRDIHQMALNIDLAPTMLALARVPIPERTQGRDLSVLWTGESAQRWRTDFLYEFMTSYDPATQARAERGRKSIPSSEGVRDERYTYLRYPFQKRNNEFLFDRHTDPGELSNLAGKAPSELLNYYRRRTDELIALNS
jgi:arylsulfatase A-like enzyme